jgi:hypothetical protein
MKGLSCIGMALAGDAIKCFEEIDSSRSWQLMGNEGFSADHDEE